MFVVDMAEKKKTGPKKTKNREIRMVNIDVELQPFLNSINASELINELLHKYCEDHKAAYSDIFKTEKDA